MATSSPNSSRLSENILVDLSGIRRLRAKSAFEIAKRLNRRTPDVTSKGKPTLLELTRTKEIEETEDKDGVNRTMYFSGRPAISKAIYRSIRRQRTARNENECVTTDATSHPSQDERTSETPSS